MVSERIYRLRPAPLAPAYAPATDPTAPGHSPTRGGMTTPTKHSGRPGFGNPEAKRKFRRRPALDGCQRHVSTRRCSRKS